MDKYFSKHLTQSFGKVKVKLGDMITHTLTNNNPSTTTKVIQISLQAKLTMPLLRWILTKEMWPILSLGANNSTRLLLETSVS